MSLQAEKSDSAYPLRLTVNGSTGGVTGLTVVVAVRRGSDYLDFADGTFKASGWTTRQAAMTEVSAANSPGRYERDFDIASSGVVVGDSLNIEYQITDAPTSDVSETLTVVETLYSPASVSQLNASVEILIDALSPTQSSLAKGTQIPNVYTGHKGDTLILPVFRNQSRMTDAELAGATDLTIRFKNLDSTEEFAITSGVVVGADGTVQYTTVDGDGVFEVAGRWQYQATGQTAGAGQPDFRSQQIIQQVKDLVPTP
jgi:hypothetical protein